MKFSPKLLLTGLAPGADTLVAEVAAEKGIAVVGALPFPEDDYPLTSTFAWSKPRLHDDARLWEDNQRRVETFQQWCHGKLADCFVVPLAEDFGKTPEELAENVKRHRRLKEKLETLDDFLPSHSDDDPALRHERYRRYRAAGEYIAAHCHVMIAIVPREQAAQSDSKTEPPHPGPLPRNGGEGEKLNSLLKPIEVPVLTNDPEHEHVAAGAAEIMKVRRNGLTPGLLQNRPAFSWGSLGPLVVIEYPADWHDPTHDAGSVSPGDVTVRVEWPSDAPRDPAAGEAAQEAHDQHAGPDRLARQQFERLMANLRECQSQSQKKISLSRDSAEAAAALTANGGPLGKADNRERIQTLLAETQTSQWPEFAPRLRQLWDLRRFAATKSQKGAKRHIDLLIWLFGITILAAILLHLSSHWHVKHDEHEGHATNSAVAADANDHHEPPALEDPAFWFRIAALGLAFFAYILFDKYRNKGAEKARFDYRALAEGLRVQVYWNLAGLGASVPASYMQRQRGEMDWFRRAISAATSPYHRWKTWFDGLQPADRIEVLSAVAQSWVREQYDYASQTYHNRAARLHAHHLRGYSLAASGLILATLEAIWMWVGKNAVENAVYGSHSATIVWAVVFAVVVVAWLTVWAVGFFWVRTNRRPGQIHQHSHGNGHGAAAHVPWPRPWLPEGRRNRFREQMFESWRWTTLFFERLAHYPLIIGRTVPYFWICVSAVAFAAALSGLLPALAAWLHVPLPGPLVWWSLSAGILLLLGAMSVAYAEKCLLSEESLQYNAMASMYRAATRRIDGHLLAARRELNAMGGGSNVPDEYRLKVVNQRIRAIQDLLREAGCQALDENAEWLILHRSRPMEPVMAG